ncbi:MAG: FtsX-like permease family protein [Saprospiraceae bacterium]|nr:ABC transporter permease [Lewinella sp.]
MIFIIAWRNIWRSRTRTLVVIGAIALGVWAALFMTGFATGMMNSYIDNAIEQVVSHIQIHNPAFKQENEVKYRIPHPDALVADLEADPDVEAISVRSLSSGMIASSKTTRGILINGVVPEMESAVRKLDEKVVSGEYFTDDRKNEILIGERLAEKLKVEVRKKVVLTFQDLNGNITTAAFRIVGMFKTDTKPFDEGQVFVKRTDLNRLLSSSDTEDQELIAHEVAILLKDIDLVNADAEKWTAKYPDLLVETYRQISPDLQLYEGQMENVSYIYLTVILLALLFGIINTMLMAVLERYRELGMLMAIGMNKSRIFSMIVLETLMLCLVAAPVGLLLGWLTITWLGTNGIDLSSYSESLAQYGMSTIVYFDVDPMVYWMIPIGVAITALIAAIYPAFKAIGLNPVEAIRKL